MPDTHIIHKIKILKRYADPLAARKKTFEVRKNDRNYQIGDYIAFTVLDDNGVPISHKLSTQIYKITYLLSSHEFSGIADGYVVFSLTRV